MARSNGLIAHKGFTENSNMYLQKSTDQWMQSVKHIYSLDPDMMAIVFF
jgi:hypothetical protein